MSQRIRSRSGPPDDRLHAIRGPINEFESRSRISFHFIRATKRREIKGGETPAGAYPNDPHRRMRRAPLPSSPACGGGRGGGARLSAFHRGACCSERTPQLSSSYALPGTWSGCTIPMVRKIVRCSAGVSCSFLSQSSGFPRCRSSCRPGVYPQSRPGAAVTSRRPREPLSLRPPASPAGVLYGSEIRRICS